MRQAFLSILAVLALAGCSDSLVEPAMDVDPAFATDLTVSSASGSLRFDENSSFRISAQSQCSDVCSVSGSAVLRVPGEGRTRFDVADLVVTTGDLIPSSVYAASFAHNEVPGQGDYVVMLLESRPRDCEGLCLATWSIDLAEYICDPVCLPTTKYTNSTDRGRISVN